MVKVNIIFLKEKLNQVLSKILEYSFFQPEEPEEPISPRRIEEARRELTTINENLVVIRKLMEEGGIELEPVGKMKINDWFEASQEIISEAKKIREEFKDLLKEIKQLEEEKSKLEEQIDILNYFKDIDQPISKLYSSEFFDIYLGLITQDQYLKLKNIEGTIVEAREVKDKSLLAILAIAPKGEIEKISKDLKLRKLELEGNLTPKEAYEISLKQLKEGIERLLGKEREILQEQLRKRESEVKEVYGKLLTLRDAFTLMSRARISEFFIQIEGYTPYKYYKKLEKILSIEGVTLTFKWPKKYEGGIVPPTLVSKPTLVKPMESILEIYGTPSYWEISPEIFIAFTFPIIFGLMFPDVGNAIVLLAFAIWFYNYFGKKRGSESNKNLGLVLIYSSIAAIITGLIAGEFFGSLPVGGLRELLDNPKAPLGPLHDIWPFPESYREILKPIIPFGGAESIVNAMILVTLLGAISLFISSLLGLINVVKKRDYEVLFFEKIPVVIIYLSPFILFLYGFFTKNYFEAEKEVLGAIQTVIFSPTSLNLNLSSHLIAMICVYMASFGLIYNFLGRAYLIRKHEKSSIGEAIGVGFVEGAFEAGILLLSNTISFIRILVFALAHYYVLYAFSYMAYLAAGTSLDLLKVAINPASIVILIVGNLLATALEGLVVFIQTMRLHFYEMFSKFYEGSGRKFEPVKTYVLLQ